MPKAWCQGWGRRSRSRPGSGRGISSTARTERPLRASERDGEWTVRAVKKASCAVGDDVVILPDDVQPGDVIVYHGVRQRVTYEFGTYALVKLGGSAPEDVST